MENTSLISKRIFISNVPSFYTEPLIKELFTAFGAISHVILIPAILPETRKIREEGPS